ncbi:transcriptional regulator [Arthrobacter sp. MYb227]|uniref:transcriptional regulator n=1 Tax=Arthrobacter sp. MYb227 TaxID=1848601 RepID=UPI000CFB8175|nr:transcriptional regulator [Arthrobacter sp. MYb227]PQZ95854.1 transcriptional regulator [Arthrobacter sp. MYb227]
MTKTKLGQDEDGVLDALGALAAAQREARQREAVLVRRARTEGFPWEAIALSLGVSRQAVHQRYGRKT